MNLPDEFKNKYQQLMKPGEYSDFIESLSKPKISGLRVNSLKIDISKWIEISPFKISPVPWSRDGFYLKDDERPGTHPYYYAGLYYIQEPSAMLPAEVLNAKPGDRVLDLCAAPGGKTVRLAADMENCGLLVSNDINPKRIKALEKNVELCGVINTVITNESPENLAVVYEGFFNKILLDVPCSGEGMFRKDPEAIRSWKRYKPFELQGLQRMIFDEAYRMLAPGGTLVYSTCTFNPEENEQNIAHFITKYPDLYLKEIPKNFGIEPGRPDWADGNPELLKTARLWPHRVNGEGHFTAYLGRMGEDDSEHTDQADEKLTGAEENIPKSFYEFIEEMVNKKIEGNLRVRGSELYLMPHGYETAGRIKTVKTGLYLGSEEHQKFVPSQSLIMSLRWNEIKKSKSLFLDDPLLPKYLKGETLPLEGEKGYIGIGVDNYPLGWGKFEEDRLKNLYPKGWRKTR